MPPQALYHIEDDRVITEFHKGQLKAWDSDKRFIFVVAGTQSGKTSFGPFWLAREIQRQGPGDYLAVTSTFDLFKLKMLPEIRYIFETVLGIARYHAGEKILEIRDPESGEFLAKRADDPMYARVILRSAMAKGGLESSTAKAAWLDECGQPEFTLETWEAVRRRLSLHRGRVLGTTTPYDLGWLKTNIYDLWELGDPDIAFIRFSSLMNPSFPRAEFEDVMSKMDEWRFNMMYRGIFTRPAGMIYNSFIDKYEEDGGHKVKAFNPPNDWPRYVGIDPGGVNTGMVWLAYDAEHNVYYAYRESLRGGIASREHAREAKALAKASGEKVIKWALGNKGESQQRRDWATGGVKGKPPPIVDVESGIDKVIALLRQHRLLIMDDLTGLLSELRTYRRKLDSDNQPTEAIENKEKYHRLDALRYIVVGLSSGHHSYVK